ncbi:hypothetical protein C0Q70_06823 [Pomacea canaliculata]|uniref:C-type lectin domain-containing protein n=1 Tax=Pomacea canaliculata TaxID=400727 RepID=A0A2T7PDC7_POMCA|nr:hypothetical protein C0Q70_06823 [Pomacea canaliculata]
MIPQRLPMARTQRCRLCLIQLLVLVLLVSDYFVLAEHPCDDQNAVYLPQKSQCIVPVKNAKDWIQAQSACERGGGSLYRLNETTGELTAYAELAACLAATPRGDGLPDDFWIGVVSQWSRHWFWINGTLLNPIQYVNRRPDGTVRLQVQRLQSVPQRRLLRVRLP